MASIARICRGSPPGWYFEARASGSLRNLKAYINLGSQESGIEMSSYFHGQSLPEKERGISCLESFIPDVKQELSYFKGITARIKKDIK